MKVVLLCSVRLVVDIEANTCPLLFRDYFTASPSSPRLPANNNRLDVAANDDLAGDQTMGLDSGINVRRTCLTALKRR